MARSSIGQAWLVGSAFLALPVSAGLIAWRSNLTADAIISAILTAALVGSSLLYAGLAWVNVLDNRESAVRPLVIIELAKFLNGKGPGAGLRVHNTGRGPALHVQFEVVREPAKPSFHIHRLGSIAHGINALPNGEARVISTGQTWNLLGQQPDPVYEVRVTYESTEGYLYEGRFLLDYKAHDHILIED